MIAAYLHVRRPSGATASFLAESCDIRDGLVTATGCFRRSSGRLDRRRSYTWPRGQIIEIQWKHAPPTAQYETQVAA